MGRLMTRMMLVVPALTMGAAVLAAAPAAATYDDSFAAKTTDGCGVVNFVDYGPGAPGGGNNDDYLVVHDYCGDSHGVKAWVWLNNFNNGNPIGEKYNGNGLAGDPVIWDPFKEYGNIIAGDWIKLKVCLVDGNGDPTPSKCGEKTHTSHDG